jgi:hypothetical protein
MRCSIGELESGPEGPAGAKTRVDSISQPRRAARVPRQWWALPTVVPIEGIVGADRRQRRAGGGCASQALLSARPPATRHQFEAEPVLVVELLGVLHDRQHRAGRAAVSVRRRSGAKKTSHRTSCRFDRGADRDQFDPAVDEEVEMVGLVAQWNRSRPPCAGADHVGQANAAAVAVLSPPTRW